MLENFNNAYMKVFDSMEAPVLAAIDDAHSRVFEELSIKEYKEQFSARFRKLFEEIYDKAKSCNNVATLQNVKVEADALKVRLLNEISKKDEELATAKAKVVAEKPADYSSAGTKPVVPPLPKIKKRKNISIKTVNVANSWQIESVQDVDKYMAVLRAQIIKELEEDTVINIEF